LRQPLAAASNYIGATLLLLGSTGEQPTEAVNYLKKAEQQILRAGALLNKLDEQIARGDFRGSVDS
jgi:hypothetical protein